MPTTDTARSASRAMVGSLPLALATTSTAHGATSQNRATRGHGRSDARPRRTVVPFPTRAARRCRTRSPGAPTRPEPQPQDMQVALAIEHRADTVDTIDNKQIAEFDAAASGKVIAERLQHDLGQVVALALRSARATLVAAHEPALLVH